MMNSTDMSTPATRADLLEAKQELRQDIQTAIAPLATKAELQAEIQAAIAPLATKAELQAAIAPLATKAELQAKLQAAIAPLATKVELEMWGGALLSRIRDSEQRLLAELARHTSAVHEAMRVEIKASMEPFRDLRDRVSRLETKVFGSTPRERRTRRRSH